MTKGRKTTWLERIEIVEFTIAKGKDYKATMEKYEVSKMKLEIKRLKTRNEYLEM